MTLAAAAAVTAMLLALGCDSGRGPNTTVSLTNADHGRSIAVLVGDAIDITLQTIGPGSYGWFFAGHTAAVPPRQLAFSAAALLTGLAYLVGIRRAWARLGQRTVRPQR